jgi:glyoxylase-like metal-dependent hydrolase (beta-lactamase superfamily II)
MSLRRPDVGTARVDFPGGNAKDLYTSIERLFKLSGDFRIFSGKYILPFPKHSR